MSMLVELATTHLPTTRELLLWDALRLASFGAATGAVLLFLFCWFRGRASAVSFGLAILAWLLLAGALLLRPGGLFAWICVALSVLAVALLVKRRNGTGEVAAGRAPGILVSAAWALGLFSIVAAVLSAASLQGAWPSLSTQRAQVHDEMRRRPADAWPRGTGHTMLSAFGIPVNERAWLEAGGSLSPSLKSFGLSIWVVGSDGQRVTTSDQIDLSELDHAYRSQPDGIDAIETVSPYYTALWRVSATNAYALDLVSRAGEGAHLELVVRSVGPAGGPIREIRKDGDALVVDGTWKLSLPAGAEIVCLGDERHTPIDDCAAGTGGVATSGDGWAFARIALTGTEFEFDVVDVTRSSELVDAQPRSDGLDLAGFPPAFTERLKALETTHLYGFEGGETRPGDPVNYPLQWQRDGAYMLVALARSGHAETARRFAGQFAQLDFFGGFGAEADAPGLSLWALGELSVALEDPVFDAAIWPDVERKADLIEEMLGTGSEMRAEAQGPVVPRAVGHPELDLVARPARNGLIDGRMDWQWPVFYVNAVSYLGLTEAARLAARLGHDAQAMEWTARAEGIRDAYRREFAALSADDPDLNNKRTGISGLWPADIADPADFAPVFERLWFSERLPDGTFEETPLWTYFSFAQAHQWLRLGEIEPVLQTLAWFDAHDIVPGLQVFWEGRGEENSSGLWREVRGHLAPSAVSPHFWANAEALLLMIEMLAYADDDLRRLVIGGGVPSAWLSEPLSAKRVGTAVGPVSWTWDGTNVLTVEAPAAIDIVPGPEFPGDTVVVRE